MHLLASRLRISHAAALGHLVMTWGGLAEFRVDGDLRGVLDHTLETWAGWAGKRGRFAGEFRRLFVGTDGAVTGWVERQGKLIERAAADRARKFRGSSAEIPSLRNDTIRNEEKASVLRTEAVPRTDLAHLMGTLRETGYAPDGRPPAPDDPARDGSVFKALLRGGRSVDDLADALRGVRAVADRQLPLPEGDRAWLAPFAKFTARWLYHTKWGSRPLADVARDVWRKGRPSGPRGGTADVGTVVERLT